MSGSLSWRSGYSFGKFPPDNLSHRSNAHLMACRGRTRFQTDLGLTVASGCGEYFGSWKGLGISDTGHVLGLLDQPGNKIWTKIRQHHCEMLGRLMRGLESIPESSGTMMDNTLIVYTNNKAEKQHSKGEDWPFVVLGNAGGRFKAGQPHLSRIVRSTTSTPRCFVALARGRIALTWTKAWRRSTAASLPPLKSYWYDAMIDDRPGEVAGFLCLNLFRERSQPIEVISVARFRHVFGVRPSKPFG